MISCNGDDRMDITTGLLLLLIGLLSGGYGVIVGAGGGFVFVPALLIIFQYDPKIAAGTGLVVVLLNSLSGIAGYIKHKRIDYKIGLTLSIGAIPGTFLGTWILQYTSSDMYYILFAGVLLALGVFLLIKKAPTNKGILEVTTKQKDKSLAYILIGLILGTISSFFGIGGGWLLVPILIYVFNIAPHKATATSLFSLSLYSSVGVISQISYGNIDWSVVFLGGAGVIIGAQFGVLLSNRISGRFIIQMLSMLLIAVSIKLFFI